MMQGEAEQVGCHFFVCFSFGLPRQPWCLAVPIGTLPSQEVTMVRFISFPQAAVTLQSVWHAQSPCTSVRLVTYMISPRPPYAHML